VSRLWVRTTSSGPQESKPYAARQKPKKKYQAQHGQFLGHMFMQHRTDKAEPERGKLAHRRDEMKIQIRKPSGKAVTEIPPSGISHSCHIGLN
jgi:hypothetical protein